MKGQIMKQLHKILSILILIVSLCTFISYAESVENIPHSSNGWFGGPVTSQYGYRIDPVTGAVGAFHEGIDLGIPADVKAPAAADGTVTFAGWSGGYGYYVVVEMADGNSFDTSHDNDKVSLVNWKVAREFIDGKTMPDGKKYYMGNTGLATALGLYSSVSRTDNGSTTYMTKMTGSSGRVSYVRATNNSYISWLTFGNAQVGESVSRAMMQVYDPENYISYGLFGQDPGAATHNRRDRTAATSTSIIRREYEWPKGRGVYPPGKATITGISLGKYFIGNIYTPIYKLVTGDEPALWDKTSEAQLNRVQRVVPAGGRYVSAKETELDNQTPANIQRTEVNTLPLYWYYSHYTIDVYPGWHRMMRNLQKDKNLWSRTGLEWKKDPSTFDQIPLSKQEKFLDKPTNKVPNPNYQPGGQGGNVYFYGNSAAQLPSIDFNDNFMWMALLPYAQTYVGDDPD